MAVKPILFNTEMVQAILEGRKSVTRRKIDEDIVDHCDIDVDGTLLNYQDSYGCFVAPEKLCRYQPGDILYVRETWRVARAHRYGADAHIQFKAGGKNKIILFPNGNTDSINRDKYDEFIHKWYREKFGWIPSIHMPKEATRIWLRVISVSVEKLQEMTAAEAYKEGVQLSTEYDTKERAYILAFADLWDSTIKKSAVKWYGWEANPFVWRIEFERCEEPEKK